MEPRFRRTQQSSPAASRNLPGMPFDLGDLDDEPGPSRKPRFSAPGRPWWRPAGTWGRAMLATAAVLVLSVFAFACHECKSFLEHDVRFRIAGTSNIQATGLTEVSRAEMLPVFGEDIGRNIFFVPLAERRKQLEQIPWVQHATVMRMLPDQIRIAVVERQPVAFVRHGQQVGLVDASGVLLSMPAAMMAQHHYSFPVLTGIDAGDPLPSRRARMDLYSRLIADLDSGGQHISQQISEIDLTDPEDARILMPEQGSDVLAHFGEDHFLDRYQRYKAHIAEWRQQYPKLAAVDLRYDTQAVLEMTPGSQAEQAAIDTSKVKLVEPKLSLPSVPAEAPKPSAAKPASQPGPKADKAQSAKSVAPAKPVVKKPAAPKTVASTSPAKNSATKSQKTAKPETVAHAKTKLSPKEQHVKALADKIRERKRAEARRAALHNSKHKPATKPHASTAGQGQ